MWHRPISMIVLGLYCLININITIFHFVLVYISTSVSGELMFRPYTPISM